MVDVPVIQLSGIIKNYITGEVTTKVLHGVNLKIKKGDFIAVTGPSGSGKSTLLNIIGLLDTATSGKYVLNGKDVTKLKEDEQAILRNREIGFIFQSYNLLQRANVLDNVVLPAIYKGVKKQDRTERAVAVLTDVGLKEHIHKKPNQLSGGQQQRVAIARALINSPTIILADEPTGNLDTKSSNEIMKILKRLNSQGNTIIMITHEPDIAKQAKHTVKMLDGQILK